ncbi:nucleotidyl transferase AbiEii/AbiGii toxin family protein [Paenibacillus nicotianae]|uniref:Nucleotidyl transferase AbiEii/AbiGii toxin family protein n=1 Tax=Paenibacillus nicotianae TaxID=1526551 RepID=A0ABW4UZU3_9BACL
MTDELQRLEQVRKLMVIAMFADDDLMDLFALKGGNALELIYKMNSRASTDIDFSMRKEFSEIGLNTDEEIKLKLEAALNSTFNEKGYTLYDVKLISKPKTDNKAIPFFAGYELKFKLIETDKYEAFKDNRHKLDKHAERSANDGRVFSIDLGRHEYCGDLRYDDLEFYQVTIYTPTLILLEKFRAICQQMEDYQLGLGKSVVSNKPRPRDFYDIYSIMKYFSESGTPIDLSSETNISHLKESFDAKKVPLSLIGEIKNTREFHKREEGKLDATVLDKQSYKGFDFYFDFVVQQIEENQLHLI